MKKKKSRVKIILGTVAIVVVVALVVVFFVSNRKGAEELNLADIPVITFFGITGNSTTEEDIIAVERDLNNVLITDGYAVKLYLAPAERYDAMIASAKAMMDAYNENSAKSADERLGFEYKFDYVTSTFDYKCDADAVTPSVVYNQDTIIERLDDGEEIDPNTPSMDVVLIKSYDDYYEMAQNGELTRLNTSLTEIAKALNQSIPAAFFDAVKLNSSGDIYGVPSVQIVGEYEFMVYDADLLDRFGFSKNQLLSLADLDSYLATVAADEEVEAIPLLNAPQSSPLELSNGKSIGITFNGALDLPFSNDDYMAQYAIVSRYRSLGYMGEVGADIENSDFAVAFFSGTEDEVEALAEKTGKNLVYSKFSMPIATSEQVGEAIFGVYAERKYSLSKSDLGIDFICKLNGPKSQTDIKNILLYGALGINYSVSDTDGKVEYANGNTYSMDNLYTGHTLHALYSDDKGVSEEWVASAQTHNLDLVSSKLSGFKFAPKTYTVGGERISGPDYLAVLDEVVATVYSDYINGIVGAVDIEDFNSRVDELIRQDIRQEVQKDFEDAEEESLSETYDAEIRADAEWMASKVEEASSSSLFDIREAVKADLTAEFRAMYNSLGVTDEEEITARLTRDLTDEVIQERLERDYTEQDIKDAAEAKLDQLVSSEVAVRVAAYKRTDEYAAVVNAYVNSAEFGSIVEQRFADERDTAYFEVLNSEIEDNLYNYSEEIASKLDEAINAANDKFIADNKISDSELEEIKLCTGFSDLLDNYLRSQYYDLKGEPK